MLKQLYAQLSELKNKIFLVAIFILSIINILITLETYSFSKLLSSIIIQFISSIALGIIVILPFAVFDKKVRNRVFSKIIIASLIVTSIFTILNIIVHVTFILK
jgi:hypothetical protein